MSSSRSRRLSANRKYHRTHVTMISASKRRFRNDSGTTGVIPLPYQIRDCNTSQYTHTDALFRSGGNVIRLLSLSAFLMLTSSLVYAQTPAAGGPAKVALYAAVGPELTAYILDVDAARLVKQASVTLPQNVQEAWPHPS